MHSRGTPQPRASRTTRWTLTLLAVAALVGGTAAPANAAGVAWMSTPTDSASATDAPDSQSPTDAETPSDAETPGDSQTSGDAEIPGDTQTPGDAENDADGETAGDVDADDTTQTPTDDETAVDSDAETEPQVEAPDADDVIEVESAEISMPTLAGFNAANLISDAVFTDKSTMTEAQIQAFFDSKVKTCRGGSDKYGPIVCLKDFRTDSVTMPADKYCTGYTGAKGESAARIIYRAAQACNINPQVLIVMLQKEQSLVTHTWPSAWRYDKALGQGCPDTAPCNPKYVGFFHQIYGAAKQMQTYLEGRYFTWYSPGKTWNVLYHPNRSCGTSPLKIANAATSAMYYYTPYQPNAAALRAGYGTGDSCSSYGNRNFYNYFTDWFGSTQTVKTKSFAMSGAKINGTPIVGQQLTTSVSINPAANSVAYQWNRNGTAIKGATAPSYTVTAADAGTSLTVRITAKKSGYADGVATTPAVKAAAVSITRLAGEQREQTALEVSRATWPKGTSTVMLATSQDFPDALSAAAAAGKASASLLLTRASQISTEVANEISRLAPTRIILVGGEGVLSTKVATQAAQAAPGAKVSRISGINRYATSRAAALAGGANDSIFIATGLDYPDAISAAAVANRAGTPVLLVHGTRTALDAATVDTLRRIGVRKATIVGGTGAVTSQIEAQIKKLGISTTRLSGINRYETNDAIVRAYFPSGAPKVLLASGENYPDALTASVNAGRTDAPLLLARQSCIMPGAADFLRQGATASAVLVGGVGVLDAGVVALRRC